MNNRLFNFGITGLILTYAITCTSEPGKHKVPKNIIFMVVDGMGPGQIDTAEIYMGDKKIRFREFPYQGKVTTHNVQGEITDSAAASSAMATGQKVSNGVLSERRPGDASELKSMLERAKELGKSTGLVTTTKFTDATPAGFGSHTSSRANKDEILEDYFSQSLPNVIFGADEAKYRKRAKHASVHYEMATTETELGKMTKRAQLESSCRANNCRHYYGGFGAFPVLPGTISWPAIPLEASSDTFKQSDVPHLSEMAKASLELLSKNQDGFFLMLESGLVDWIGHSNRQFSNTSNQTSSAYALGKEFEEINRTIDVFLEFRKSHPETLIIVTADHETGGLMVNRQKTSCIGTYGCLAHIAWTSPMKDEGGEQIASHTGVDVGVFAIGENASLFATSELTPMDNTNFVSKIFGKPTP